jgi:hypothetical protein
MKNRFAMVSLAALGGFMLTAPIPAGATPQRPLRELRCDMLEQNRGRLETVEAPGLRVLEQTANGLPFTYAIPQGIAGISCGRTSVIPAAWDDRVITVGLPLFIASDTRLGVLEIDNGRFRYRFIRGQAQPDEQAQIDERIQQFQSRFDAAQRQSTRQ